VALPKAISMPRIDVRETANFVRPFNAITPVQMRAQKYSCFFLSEFVVVYACPALDTRGAAHRQER